MSLAAAKLAAQQPHQWEGGLRVGTFSIAAVDAETGGIGIAVTSRVPCIGSIVPHVREGVGVVATQALIRVEYGAELLDLLAAGTSPADALKQALASDPLGAERQIGVIAAMVVADPRPARAPRPDRISVDIDICESENPVLELRRVYNSVSGTLGYRTLQQFHGSDVVQLKIILHALGFFRPEEAELRMELSAPFFTQEVVNAVNAFREAHRLSGPASGSPPGLVDAATIELMWEDLQERGIAGDVRRRIRDLNRR